MIKEFTNIECSKARGFVRLQGKKTYKHLITKKNRKRLLSNLMFIFALMNTVAYFHAYHFTHFSEHAGVKTCSPEKLSTFDKLKTLILGVNNPRPINKKFPARKYETINLSGDKNIECWLIKAASNDSLQTAFGTVIIFHGYGADKSSMLDKSDEFLKMGYNTLLVDFMGSGGSEGNQTTIGFKEAAEVKMVYDYLIKQDEKHVFLFGTSMGSVAIMKAIKDYHLDPDGIIIECPFGSMYETTTRRFRKMGVPAFPMAGLLVFWGGAQNGFWGFAHRPVEYAKAISCPTLLLYGEKDKSVSRQEIDAIFSNLKGMKTLKTYAQAGHENYLIKYREEWVRNVESFMMSVK